jgi:hypothetical protein
MRDSYDRGNRACAGDGFADGKKLRDQPRRRFWTAREEVTPRGGGFGGPGDRTRMLVTLHALLPKT